jgi:hypothetical protein
MITEKIFVKVYSLQVFASPFSAAPVQNNTTNNLIILRKSYAREYNFLFHLSRSETDM